MDSLIRHAAAKLMMVVGRNGLSDFYDQVFEQFELTEEVETFEGKLLDVSFVHDACEAYCNSDMHRDSEIAFHHFYYEVSRLVERALKKQWAGMRRVGVTIVASTSHFSIEVPDFFEDSDAMKLIVEFLSETESRFADKTFVLHEAKSFPLKARFSFETGSLEKVPTMPAQESSPGFSARNVSHIRLIK